MDDILCPECRIRLGLSESVEGHVITMQHPRPWGMVTVKIPGFGGGIAGAPLSIRAAARDLHDPFGR